ncbi:hypothetical protein C8R42DRAFT_730094 [Lentinula raphanica]|nr:hypothetical protein C8R42DRAFT_730094 [Lentinula raphanica]
MLMVMHNAPLLLLLNFALCSQQTPISSAFPSPQLDPTYPRRRFAIPSRPPPPPPRESLVPSPAVSEIYNLLVHPMNPKLTFRPPPRISIPADFGFFPEDGGQVVSEEEDDSLILNLPMLNASLSQFSIETIDRPMMLPLSLPNSPIDLKADIAHGLAELRMRPEADASTDKVSDNLPILTKPAAPVELVASLLARRQMRRNMTVSVPLTFDWYLLVDEESAAEEAQEEIALRDVQDLKFKRTSFVRKPPFPTFNRGGALLHCPPFAKNSRVTDGVAPSCGSSAAPKSEHCILHPVYNPQSLPPPRRSLQGDPKQTARNNKRAVVVVGPPSTASGSSGWSFGSALHAHG